MVPRKAETATTKTGAGTAIASVAIAGGGAAGFFAAVNIAEKWPGTRVVIYEAAGKPLQKVAISGGGRCNVTHHCFDPRLLSENYPRGQKAVLSLFSRFQPHDMVNWCASRGLTLHTEADGRMFPQSNRSQQVIDLFLDRAKRLGVDLRTRSRVTGIQKTGEGFTVTTPDTAEPYDKVILATGYSPPGWQLAKHLGHTVIPPVPSLFPFKISDPLIAGLQGISVPHAKGKLTVGKQAVQAAGPCLITHTGLSGPVIYRLSAYGARILAEANYQATVFIDWVPDLSDDELRAELARLFHRQAAKTKISNIIWPKVPRRLWERFLALSGAPVTERGEVTGKKVINKLVELIKRAPLPVTGRNPSKEEFVSCGGVPLNEVDFKTMESKIVPGLYLAGEILDIDALTGGFNFQACWSEGWVISESFQKNC